MREIKFRIFNKSSGKMFLPYQYKNGQLLLRMWDGMIVDVYEAEMREVLRENEAEHLIPLQFTGLKDCKGVEVYDGDIIKIGDSKWFDAGYYETGVVEFKNCAWYFGNVIPYSIIQSASQVSDTPATNYNIFEVIGNIYENPDLIK